MIDAKSIDYRTTRNAQFAPTKVPQDIANNCVALSRDIGLPLTGIDFKIEAKTGHWFFLEINSLPCFQPYDRRLDGAISAAIVRYLTGC